MLKRRPTRIAIPNRLRRKLEANRELEGQVLSTLADFEPWLEDNKLVFFPEYTDHGPDHIRQVIETTSSLIADRAWKYVTAEDAALIVLSSLLHDCAMHLSEDGFIVLVTRNPSWSDLWERFLGEASRFDGRKLYALFGDTEPARSPPLDATAMTKRDRLLIGEFLRRHHPGLAQEIAIDGVPGPGAERLRLHVAPRFAALAGDVARSHGMAIRNAVDLLAPDDRRTALGTHPPFVMALLRIADYIQVQSERAPKKLLTVRALRSPISYGEWRMHEAIESIHTNHEDPEAIYIKALPRNAADFVKAQRLFRSMQQELDETWALLGEIYGRFEDLSHLTLTVRRIRSSLDHVEEFAKRVDFVPAQIGFTTAGADLLKLLVGPLYGNKPPIGLRELLQNAVDAVLELRDYRERHAIDETALPKLEADVVVLFRRKAREPWTMIVQDRGIGMTMEVIRDYFLRAGASFRNSDAWRAEHTDYDGAARVLRSGRFGVGALAAYLLGNQIEVTTRHATAETALTFSASLSDDVIDIRHTNAPIGTKISVKMRGGPPNPERFNDWQWFRLSDPSVVIDFDGALPQTPSLRPGLHEPPACEWRRIHPPGYAAVDWAYGLPTEVTCNGIHIRGNTPHVIGAPAISVFDPNGNLPLDLQRENISEYPFQQDLVDDIVRDLVAFAAVVPDEDARAIVVEDQTERWEHGAVKPGWLMATPIGWRHRDLVRRMWTLVLVKSRSRPVRVAEAIDFSHSAVAQYYWDYYVSFQDMRGARFHSSIHTPAGGGPPLRASQDPRESAFIHDVFLRIKSAGVKSWRVLLPDRVYEPDRHPYKSTHLNGWHLLAYGPDFHGAVDFEKFTYHISGEEDPCDAIIELDSPHQDVDSSVVAIRWSDFVSEYFPNGAIPFAIEERRRLTESEVFRPYVERHRELLRRRTR